MEDREQAWSRLATKAARYPSMFTRLRHGMRKQRHALWMSATAVAFVGMYRAACIVLVDASGNFVDDLLNSWLGRIGEWLALASVMAAYAVHLRRQECARCAVSARTQSHRARRTRSRPTCSPPAPTRAFRRMQRMRIVRAPSTSRFR